MKLPLLLFCVVLMTLNNVVVHAGLTPPGPSATDDIPSARTHALLRNPQVHALKENSDNTQEDDDCGDLNDDCLGKLRYLLVIF